MTFLPHNGSSGSPPVHTYVDGVWEVQITVYQKQYVTGKGGGSKGDCLIFMNRKQPMLKYPERLHAASVQHSGYLSILNQLDWFSISQLGGLRLELKVKNPPTFEQR